MSNKNTVADKSYSSMSLRLSSFNGLFMFWDQFFNDYRSNIVSFKQTNIFEITIKIAGFCIIFIMIYARCN